MKLASRRNRWVVIFALLALAISAVPVMADSAFGPEPETTVPPTPADIDPSTLPDGKDVAEAIELAEREEAIAQEQLETPQARQEREESEYAYSEVSAGDAKQLLSTEFSDRLDSLNADPARFLSDAELNRSIGQTVAAVTSEGDSQLLDAGIPVRVENGEGDVGKVDLGLQQTADGYEPQNPLVELSIPESADDAVEIGASGLSIRQVGADEDSSGQFFGDKNVFYPEVQTDTDLLVAPVSGGVELFDQLRSTDSPEALHFHLEIPAGAEIRADGNGAAEIVLAGGEPFARIAPPTATDAQGADVPVSLEIEESSIVLRVPHREGDFAYPILVDPEAIMENWYTPNWLTGWGLEALTNGTWWYANNVSWIYGSTYCIYKCWGGSNRGLYVSAPSGAYGANQFGHWGYSTLNSNTFIPKVWLNPFWRENHGCSKSQYPEPHDYLGIWAPSGWLTVLPDKANDTGLGDVSTPYQTGQSFIAGLSSGGGGQPPCWRDLVIGGAAVFLDDKEQPTLTTTSSGQWMDKSPVRLNVSASDGGLGIKWFKTTAQGASGSPQEWWTTHSCTGLRQSPCPATWNLGEISQPSLVYDPSVLPEGIVTMNVTAYDPTWKPSTSINVMTVRVDHASPTLKLSGTILEQAKLGTEKPGYTIRTEASDGIPNDSNPANARSGVVSISEWIDGKQIHAYTPGCPVQSCSWTDELLIESAAYTPGQHTLVVKAADALNHVAESAPLNVTLGDSKAPSLSVTGLPTESSAMPSRTSYLSSFGKVGSGNGQLKAPADVAVDASGNLWVADKGNNRIEKFSSSGAYLSQVGTSGSGNGQFSSPASIAIDPKGNLWVADKGNGRVQKFNEKGEYLSQFGSKGTGNGQFGSGGPEGLAIDAKGNIWVSDTYNGRVQEFSESGAFIKVVGTKGSGVGQLGEPTGIDIGPNGNVWVADWQNNRVAVFNEAGEFVRQFGSTGTGNGQFNRPDAIAVGTRGDVWVGDQENGRIQEFDQNGAYLGQFGSKGSGAGQFNFAYPMGLVTDSKGSLWIADTINSRIQRWLIPNTTVDGYFEPITATATDTGFGVTSVALKLTDAAGTEVLQQATQTCSNGGCPLSFSAKEVDLSGKASGPYLLTVTATDGAGNVRESSRVISLDSTPPDLELSGALADGAGQPLSAPSADLEISASDSDPTSGGITRLNVERDGQLVASYPSNCSSDCHEVDASYTYRTAVDGANRSIKPVAASGNGSIGELKRVSCAAVSDCWAVGRTKYTLAELLQGKTEEPLLERWNGSEWQATTVPKPVGATNLFLEGVSCTSASACVAVGYYVNGTNQPLAELWNGTTWTASSPPLPSGYTKGYFSGISCGSSGDCWAYGKTEVSVAEQNEGKTASPFFSHWKGGSWQTTFAPKPSGATNLFIESISCATASACVAVGYYVNGTNQPLAELWNGTTWTPTTPALLAGYTKGSLNRVSCGSSGDCWAYGKTEVSVAEQNEGKTASPFFSHWKGGSWQVEATPKVPNGSTVTVTSISCVSEACTAVGRYANPQAETLPLAYTRDATGWRFQPMPTRTEATNSSLEWVSCTAAYNCGAIGYSRAGTGQWQVLAEAERPDTPPHLLTVEAIDVQGNSTSRTIEVDATAAPQAPECSTEPKSEASYGVVTPGQAVVAIQKTLAAAVAPTEGATAPTTELEIDPSYSSPSPNLEMIDSLTTGETAVTAEGGFTLGDDVCFAPAALTPAATDAAVVGGDAALFANTSPATDTVIRPTAMGTTVVQSLRGPQAPDTLSWNVTLSEGQKLVELPSGAVAVVVTGSKAEDVADVPSPPGKSPDDLANVERQIEESEYQLIDAADETQMEVVAVIARPYVVLYQGGIVPALIEVAPDVEIPNVYQMTIVLPTNDNEAAVYPAQLVMDTASTSSLNGNCSAAESPCGALDLDRAAEYAMFWGDESHHYARNPYYRDFGADNCTNFISQILRAGGMKFMRAFEHGDGSWWYRNFSNGMFSPPDSGNDNTQSWSVADILPRHLWRFDLVHIDPVQQPWGWTKGNILAYDWIDSDGKGNVNHLNFVVGTSDSPGGREPLVANSSSTGSNYPHKAWQTVKARIELAHGSQWTRFALAAKHRAANLYAKKHTPSNLWGPGGLFNG